MDLCKNPIFHPLLLNNQNKKFISFKGSFVSFYLIHRSVITHNLSMNEYIAWLKKKVCQYDQNESSDSQQKHYTKRWVYNKKRGKILEKLERSYIRFDSTLYFTIEPKKKKKKIHPIPYIKGNSSIIPKLTVWVFCIDYVLEENKNEQKSNGSLDGLFQKIILMGFVRSSSI